MEFLEGDRKRMKIKLADFVELCNNCLNDLSEQSPKLDEAAKKLGNAMLDKKFQDKDDEEFLRSLERRAYTSSSMQYVFLQNEKVIAKIALFSPFVNMGETNKRKQILSQKWHVLIAILAYLDTASFDIHANMDDKFDIGQIKNIEIDTGGKRMRINGQNKSTKWYSSKFMNKWINEFIVPEYYKLIKG